MHGMEHLFSLLLVLWLGLSFWNRQEQRKRMALLAEYLRPYQIEKQMESLINGYLRALGEQDPVRQEQVWGVLQDTERNLQRQFSAFAADLQRAEGDTRMAPIPYQAALARYLGQDGSFDLRELMPIHARGILACQAPDTEEDPESRKRRAFAMTAELMLMQHSCHWYCRSRALASARLHAPHKTSYGQVLAAVTAGTRQAYSRLPGMPATGR